MRLVSVNAGAIREARWTTLGRSAIDKAPVRGRVRVGRLGLAGDEISNTRHHGGSDQALYAFAREDLDAWGDELGAELPDGAFGENLTTAGLDVNEAEIGERWRLGDDVLVEVASVRTPCHTFKAWLDRCGYDASAWVRRFAEAGRPGPYLRVLEEGTIGAGDPVEVVHQPGHGVTVSLAFRALTTERALLPRLLSVGALSARARARAEAYVEAQG